MEERTEVAAATVVAAPHLASLPADLLAQHIGAYLAADGFFGGAAVAAFAATCSSIRAAMAEKLQERRDIVMNHALNGLLHPVIQLSGDARPLLRQAARIDIRVSAPFSECCALGHTIGAASHGNPRTVCLRWYDQAGGRQQCSTWKLPLLDLNLTGRCLHAPDAAFLAGLCMRDAGVRGSSLHVERVGAGVDVASTFARPLGLRQHRSLASDLQSLWVAHCNLGDDGVERLVPAVVNGSPSLFRLCLSHNALSDAGVRALAAALATGALSHLREVLLNGNRICCISALCDAFAARPLVSLQWLDLAENHLTSPAALGLAAAVSAGGRWRLVLSCGSS